MRHLEFVIVIFVVFFSGCVDSSSSDAATVSTPSEPFQSNEQAKILELEEKIESMQNQLNDIQVRLDNINVPKPSNRSILPEHFPFSIEVKFGEWQIPNVWTFYEGGNARIVYGSDVEYVSYKIFRNNNSIKIESPKYEFWGLVFYEEYVTAIYKNGWINWAQEYRIISPRYNALTQQYELP